MTGGAAGRPTVASIIFHGDRDGTVQPDNGTQALEQAIGRLGQRPRYTAGKYRPDNADHEHHDQMVRDAPIFSEVADSFMRFMGDGIFVAHNVNFDYGFISYEYERLERRFRFPKRRNGSAISGA